MKSVEIMRDEGEFTVFVRPPGWGRQTGFLIAAVISLFMAFSLTNSTLHGRFKINDRVAQPIEAFYSLPLWAAGLGFLAAAFQRAHSKTMFVASAQSFVITIMGPLRTTSRHYGRHSLREASVAFSQTRVMGRQLKQLQLYFRDAPPYQLFTGRDDDELACIAQNLTDNVVSTGTPLQNREKPLYTAPALQPDGEPADQPSTGSEIEWSPVETNPDSAPLRDSTPLQDNRPMEVRQAPIFETQFKKMCAVGVAVGFVSFALFPIIGPCAIVPFFVAILVIIISFSRISGTCKCPQCKAPICRDRLSSQGRFQYTCYDCRIIWQSPVGVGSPPRF